MEKTTNQRLDRSWIEIDLSAFATNLSNIKKYFLPNQKFMQVVKADAYGHGSYQIAKTSIENGAVMLGVANIEEALYLRFRKITIPILALSPIMDFEVDNFLAYDIIPTISDIETSDVLNKKANLINKKIHVHLKIDTGMNRTGVKYELFETLLESFFNFKNLIITGLYSHFAASEENDSFSKEQYERFLKCVNLFKTQKFKKINKLLEYVHIANSAGLILHNSPEVNLVRIGLISYGYNLIDPKKKNDLKLLPIMTFKTRIAQIKTMLTGETIGYNRTFKAEKPTKYAVIPIGYADGYDFLLSNTANVLINGTLCSVLGKISMDMICVDLTAATNAKLYDEVVILGGDSLDISADHLVYFYKSSVYELLCQLGRRAKRYYYINHRLVDDEPLQRRDFVPNDFERDKLNDIICKALTHKIRNEDISVAIIEDILQNTITYNDKDVSYRTNFKYNIKFTHSDLAEYYKASIVLKFSKTITEKEFKIVCTNDASNVKKIFEMTNCEYRWILGDNVVLSEDMFVINKIQINNYDLKYRMIKENNNIIFNFTDDIIKKLNGTYVDFCLEVETLYPKKNHQITVYINEVTKGIEINFYYPKDFTEVAPTIIFSGRERFPDVIRSENKKNKLISIKTNCDTWIFPSSGIVFSY